MITRAGCFDLSAGAQGAGGRPIDLITQSKSGNLEWQFLAELRGMEGLLVAVRVPGGGHALETLCAEAFASGSGHESQFCVFQELLGSGRGNRSKHDGGLQETRCAIR